MSHLPCALLFRHDMSQNEVTTDSDVPAKRLATLTMDKCVQVRAGASRLTDHAGGKDPSDKSFTAWYLAVMPGALLQTQLYEPSGLN